MNKVLHQFVWRKQQSHYEVLPENEGLVFFSPSKEEITPAWRISF